VVGNAAANPGMLGRATPGSTISKGKLDPEGAALPKEVEAALQTRRHPKIPATI